VDQVVYGDPVKFYIEAHATDHDMLRIAVSAYEVGWGTLPVDWTYLKGQNQKEFKGYLQWNTFSSKASYLNDGTQITMKVSVIDKAGNESNVVVFPFTFEGGVKGQYQYKPPAPFDQGDIPRVGYIHTDLYEPTKMGDDGASGN
jgi:hypothetical protein